MARKVYSESFNKRYKRYLRLYRAQERSFEKANIKDFAKRERLRGRTFLNKKSIKQAYARAVNKGDYIRKYLMREDKLTRSQFLDYYPATQEHIEKEGLNVKDVSKFIVSKQAFERSRTQYRALKARQEELLSDIGLDLSKTTEMEFRKGYFEMDLSEAIKSEYYYMKDELGITDSYFMRDRITELFFNGSK